jgi:hypothetical protein
VVGEVVSGGGVSDSLKGIRGVRPNDEWMRNDTEVIARETCRFNEIDGLGCVKVDKLDER